MTKHKDLKWRLTSRIPDETTYKELKKLRSLLRTEIVTSGLCNFAYHAKLSYALTFINDIAYFQRTSYMATLGLKAPRVFWLTHYITNFENSKFYKLKNK